MATRIVEGKNPYTGGKAITVDENKVISLNLREENNLIIYDAGDDEIYVDLQLPDGITPLDAFPVGITVGRVLVADDWDVTGTLACFKTTSGDNIKLLYGDDGKVYIDNGTGLFKQIYLKGEVDTLLQALRDYVDAQLALKQDLLIAGDYIEINENVISAVIPTMSRFLSIWNASSGEPISFPASTPFLYTTGDYYLIEGVGVSDNYRPAPIEYDGSASIIPETDEVANGDVYIYDGAVWLLQTNHGKTVTFQNIAGDPYDNTNLATALNAKQNTLVNQSNIKSINNNSLLGTGDLSIAEVPSGGTNGQVLTQTSQGPAWQNATGGADIEYKTQAEYNALLPGALTDNKHYFIYTASGGGGWQPGVNTIAYYPLNSTYTDTDQSGNNNNGTTVGTLSYGDNYCQFSSGNYISIPTIIPYGANPYTISVWYNTSDSSGHQNVVYCQVNSSIENTGSALFVYQGHLYYWGPGSYDWDITSVSINNDTWYNIVFTYTGTQLECFVNGVSKGTFIRTISSTAPSVANIGKGHPEICIGKTSNLIIENKVRTASEISDYYDQTKSSYGIS